MNETTRRMLLKLASVGGTCELTGTTSVNAPKCVLNSTGMRGAREAGYVEIVSTGKPGTIVYSRTYKVPCEDMKIVRLTDAGRAAL